MALSSEEDIVIEGQGNLNTLVNAVIERLNATLSLTSSTLQLAKAESKLALSSVGLFLAAWVLLAFMIAFLWAVLLVTSYQILLLMGLSALQSMTVLLCAQISFCGLILLLIRKVASRMRFAQTRKALFKASDT